MGEEGCRVPLQGPEGRDPNSSAAPGSPRKVSFRNRARHICPFAKPWTSFALFCHPEILPALTGRETGGLWGCSKDIADALWSEHCVRSSENCSAEQDLTPDPSGLGAKAGPRPLTDKIMATISLGYSMQSQL